MNKKEISEIKKQFTPENCSLTRICGCYIDGKARTVIGARPGKAMIVEDEEGILKDFVQMNAQQKKDAAASFAAYAAEHVSTDKNMRASKEYRSLLVKVLTRRAWEEIGGRAE